MYLPSRAYEYSREQGIAARPVQAKDLHAGGSWLPDKSSALVHLVQPNDLLQELLPAFVLQAFLLYQVLRVWVEWWSPVQDFKLDRELSALHGPLQTVKVVESEIYITSKQGACNTAQESTIPAD